ncbi:MAG: methyltransferase domain-containing protein [Chitinophagales bacterium]|nr:methyltransferase domain-containing protein [Chitinophagales bacterium]
MKKKVAYDKYYQTENLFGQPYPELIDFFAQHPHKGKLLDLGCGQGRDAIPLARLGYTVTGIDHSKVGIEQMNQLAIAENLPLTGIVADIFEYDGFGDFDFVLLDSMFHFTKKDQSKESNLIKRILAEINEGCLLIICIQDSGNKVAILNEILNEEQALVRLADKKLKYIFEDKESGHQSVSDYRMLVLC